MSEFWINFLSNLASDGVLAIVILIAITRPNERRKTRKLRSNSFGLLKAELLVNKDRAQQYVRALRSQDSNIASLFPLRYTRGAWNALKDSGFLATIEDPILSYYLFRMNESALVASKNLRRYQLAHLEETGGDLALLRETASSDSELLITILDKVLERMEGIEVPSAIRGDLFIDTIEEVQDV